MRDSKPIISESGLKLMEMQRDSQRYSYDLTQRLAFFVISIELVFCGYILLNADKLGAARFSSLLFLLAGVAALFGIAWRFFYNQTFHDIAHENTSKTTRLLYRIHLAIYWIFISVTALFLISTILVGYLHIHEIETKLVSKAVSGIPDANPAKGRATNMEMDKSDNSQVKATNGDKMQRKATK